jgi:hypothetical protein
MFTIVFYINIIYIFVKPLNIQKHYINPIMKPSSEAVDLWDFLF